MLNYVVSSCRSCGSCFINHSVDHKPQEQKRTGMFLPKYQNISEDTLWQAKNMARKKRTFGQEEQASKSSEWGVQMDNQLGKVQSRSVIIGDELWKQFHQKDQSFVVLATLDVSSHIGIYLFVYTGNFEVPISNLEYRLFCLFSRIVSFGQDDFTCISNPGWPTSRDCFVVVIFISQY